MPAPATAERFLELVRKSGVVDEDRLNSYLETARAVDGLPAQPPDLAERLVRDGVLTTFQAGQVLKGKFRGFFIGNYKVLEELGTGGMGCVYLCEHKVIRRRVALKVLPIAKATNPAAVERFQREARAVAAINHSNLVRAIDSGQEGKLYYLVMEYVDGVSLQQLVHKSGPMPALRAAHYIRQGALGLQAAHEAGLVHRDIKPGNLLVDRSGTVKILDLGLARFFHDTEDVLTQKYQETVLGTADYLAPEQAVDSHTADIRADIYSLGATFYYCLTGRPPFAEGTVAQKLIWQQSRQPKPIKLFRPELPAQLIAIVEKMMAKSVAQRFQTPAEVAQALARWTAKPIAPPSEAELPQLCPAARSTSAVASRPRPKRPAVRPKRNDAMPWKPAPETDDPTAHADTKPPPSPVPAPAPAARAPAKRKPALARQPKKPAPKPKQSGRRWWLVGALVLAALVAASAVVVLLRT
jgi:serine/threonine protein kinase